MCGAAPAPGFAYPPSEIAKATAAYEIACEQGKRWDYEAFCLAATPTSDRLVAAELFALEGLAIDQPGTCMPILSSADRAAIEQGGVAC